MAECFGDKHVKNQDLFCNECGIRVCSKCFKKHSAHAEQIVDIDQLLLDSQNSIDNVVKFIDENVQRKNQLGQMFHGHIDQDFDSENNKITEYFKNLHDSLHYKEVDLKRELKSHYDENYEAFVKMSSIIENNVHQSQEILKLLDQNKDDSEMVLKKFNDFKILSQTSKLDILSFTQHKFKDVPYNDFETIVNKNVIKPPTHLDSNNNLYIYLFYNELERFNLKTKKLEKVETKPMERRPESIWQSMCSTSKHLYIFNNSWWWKYEPSTESWSVHTVPDNQDLGGYQPVFYDGKKHIYLLGGYKGSIFYLDVTRFDIETETFEFNFAKLNSSHQNNPVIINGDEKKIYLCGGYHNKDTDTLDLLDVDARTVTTLHTFRGNGFPNLTTGCYVPATNSIYMITREYLFFRYDMQERKVIPLANPTGNGYYNKLFFDGENTMYLMSTKLKGLWEYNIERNLWSLTISDFNPNSGWGSTLSRL